MSYWSMTLPGTAAGLREVRRFTRGMLQDAPGTDDVVQAASELAANAVLHTTSGDHGGTFTLHIATYTNRWQIRIDDGGGPRTPQIQTPVDDHIPTGRGLTIVAALASTWGVLGNQYGRAVWAEIPFPVTEAPGE